MFDLTFHSPAGGKAPTRVCIANCDKDGSLVSARLASALGGISSTRPMKINPDRHFDQDYFLEMGDKLAGFYDSIGRSELLDSRTLVVGSVHPAVLYIAEVLHAPVLPLQLISFAEDLGEAQVSDLINIVGSDYGVSKFWLWNKIAKVRHFPKNYVQAVIKAEDLVVVRSMDTGEDCPIEGRIGNALVNSTLRSLNPKLWGEVAGFIEDRGDDYSHLRQWEWGLPDATIEAVKSLWDKLGKNRDRLHIIEAGTIELYQLIPVIWEAYLNSNRGEIRGCTLNAYWTSHPYYERHAGLIPIHFYKFSMLEDIAFEYVSKYCRHDPTPESFCVFANNVGGQTDLDDVRSLISHFEAWGKCWYSEGFDSPGASCTDRDGNQTPSPYEMVGDWIQTAPYRTWQWNPLELEVVLSVCHEQH